MENANHLWTCWINENEKIISFHEASGFWRQLFHTGTDFWAYVEGKTRAGYRVQ